MNGNKTDACMLMSVASGDNMDLVQAINSAHKLKVTPSLVPCCEGKELQIQEDLVRCGLSAISVKHEGLGNCLSMSHACQRLQVAPGIMKHRNSFRSLHRPDLKRVSYLRRMAPEDLENLFHGYANFTKSPHGNSVDNKNFTLEPKSPPADEIPEGKRLHGVQARMFTSVLASVFNIEQMDISAENYVHFDPETMAIDTEDIEQLQVILPPKPHDIFPASSFIGPTCSSLIQT